MKKRWGRLEEERRRQQWGRGRDCMCARTPTWRLAVGSRCAHARGARRRCCCTAKRDALESPERERAQVEKWIVSSPLASPSLSSSRPPAVLPHSLFMRAAAAADYTSPAGPEHLCSSASLLPFLFVIHHNPPTQYPTTHSPSAAIVGY